MNIAIITSGYLPVPSVSGGAVENLIENILKENIEDKKNIITIFSIFNDEAVKESLKYPNAKFFFIKSNNIIKLLDNIIYIIAKNLLKVQKTISYRYIFQRLFFIKSVSRLLKRENFDKVVIENHPTLFLSLKLNKNYKKYAKKYYFHIHNDVNKDYKLKNIICNSRKFICVSKYSAMQASNFFKDEMDENKYFILKNCIDQTNYLKPIDNQEIIELKKKFDILEIDKIIIFVGRLIPEKGIDQLLLALEKIKYENYKLLIVGSYFFETGVDSNYVKTLKSSIEKIKDKIIFTGFIPNNIIYKFYSMATIAVLPSMWDEPAGLTLIESMNAGLPIITTKSGGIPEYVNEKCAFILERNDNLINEIANKIDLLLNNDSLQKKMSKESKKNALKYGVKEYYNEFISILGEYNEK